MFCPDWAFPSGPLSSSVRGAETKSGRRARPPGALSLDLYNEIFINGALEIGRGQTVERFDGTRFSLALGYGVTGQSRLETGYMIQTQPHGSNGQPQVSWHTTL